MNSQIKQQWLTALRSGEYSQARWNLQSTEGYCCLGVLCDLYSKETATDWDYDVTEDDTPFHYYNFEGESSILPLSVVQWAELDSQSPIVKFSEDGHMDLANINDSGSTFTEIAELIEEQM